MEKKCQQCGGKLTRSSSGSWVCLPCFAGLFGGEEDEEGDELYATEDRYEIGEVLGRGANGTVYRAHDRKLKREVAVKRLNALIPDRNAEARFQLELETIASLEHPHVIPIWDHGELDGRAFYVMRYVEGGTLGEALDRRWEVKESVRLMLQIVQAVAHGHARGVLHRDLKPENILLENGDHAFVTDFGLAKRFTEGEESGLSLTGQVIGTPAYMAPEQALGEKGKVTTATDVFALGGILFLMLTGRRAFRGEESHVILKQVIEDQVKLTQEERKWMGNDLATVCLKCLEKEPGRRYATAEEFGQDLERFLDGHPVVARPISRLARAGRWAKRHPAQSVLLGLVSALVIGFVAFVVHSRNELLKEQEIARQERARGERQLYYANLSLVGEDAKNLDFIGLTQRIAEMETYEGAGFELDYWKSRVVRPERSLPRAAGGAAIIDIASSGDRYLAGGSGGQVEVFDLEGKILGKYTHDEKTVKSYRDGKRVFNAFFLDEGKVVASFARESDFVVWRVSDGTTFPKPSFDFIGIQEVPEHPDSVVGLTADGEVVFWKWETGEVWKQRKIEGATPPDHGFFVIVGDELVSAHGKIWNLETGGFRELINDVNWNRDATVELSRDGKRMMAYRRLFEFNSGRLFFNLRNTTWEGRNVFLESGMVASSTGAAGIMVWLPEAKDWQHPFWLKRYEDDPVASLALSPDGEWLLTGTSEGGVDIWRTADFTEFSLFRAVGSDRGVFKAMTGIEYSSSGKYLATASNIGLADVWDAQSGELLFSQKCHDDYMCGTLFVNDSKWVFTAGNDGRASIWDWRKGEELITFPKGDSAIWAMAAHEESGQVAVAYRSGKVVVWDRVTGDELRVFEGGFQDSCALAFSDDGKGLLAGGWGDQRGSAVLWDLQSGEVMTEFVGHQSWIGDALFYDNGSKVLTSSADRTVRSWNAKTGEELRVFDGHNNTVNAMRISKDGTRLFTGSDDETARVWDVVTGRQLLVIPSAYGPVHYLDLSPDERQLAASSEGVAIVWDIRNQEEKRDSRGD